MVLFCCSLLCLCFVFVLSLFCLCFVFCHLLSLRFQPALHVGDLLGLPCSVPRKLGVHGQQARVADVEDVQHLLFNFARALRTARMLITHDYLRTLMLCSAKASSKQICHAH